MKLKENIRVKILESNDLQRELAYEMKRGERNIEELAKRNHENGKLTTIAAVKVIMDELRLTDFFEVVE
jgi:hypothetical protein